MYTTLGSTFLFSPPWTISGSRASAGRRPGPGQSNHRRSTGSPPSAVVTKARGCVPLSIFPLPRPIGHSREPRAESGGADAVEPPAGPIAAATAFAQARAPPCAGMASPNGPGKSRKGRLSRKAKVPPLLSPLVQDAKQVSKAGKGAHVKVGHVVVVVEALVPSWVLKQGREPIVDERSGPSVEVQHKVVHGRKAKAAQAGRKEGPDVGNVGHGGCGRQVPIVNPLIKVAAMAAAVHVPAFAFRREKRRLAEPWPTAFFLLHSVNKGLKKNDHGWEPVLGNLLRILCLGRPRPGSASLCGRHGPLCVPLHSAERSPGHSGPGRLDLRWRGRLAHR